MRQERVDSIELKCVTIDSETALIQPGLATPELVLGSAAMMSQETGEIVAELLSRDDVLATFEAVLDDPDAILGGANVPFDVLVFANEAAKEGRDLMPKICRMYEDDRVWDVLTMQALDAVANGCLGKDPETREQMRDPISGTPSNRYSLAITHHQLTGRSDAKANDVYRSSYAQFKGVPLDQLPPAARDYPVDDSRNTHEDVFAQAGLLPRAGRHDWMQAGTTVCRKCGIALSFGDMPPCMRIAPQRNIHDLANQCRAAFAMAVGAAWGFRVNQKRVDIVEARVVAARAAVAQSFLDAGILRWKKEKGVTRLAVSMSALARRVAVAYGAKNPCAECSGTGKVPSTANPRSKINCEVCAASGFDLSSVPHLPRTPAGRISCADDVLEESGDELLMTFASEYNGEKKTLQVYVPYLRRGRHSITLRDIALTLWPNVILETGRSSYGGSIHQFPRKGGLRECIEARPPQYELVEVPDDYVLRPGEMLVEPEPTPVDPWLERTLDSLESEPDPWRVDVLDGDGWPSTIAATAATQTDDVEWPC